MTTAAVPSPLLSMSSSSSSQTREPREFTAFDRWGTVFSLVLMCSAIEANASMLPSLWAVSEGASDDGAGGGSLDASTSIRADLDLTITEFGLLTSYVSIGPRAIMMYAAGRIAGRVRRKKLLVMIAGALQILGMGVFLTARGFWQVAAASVLINVSLGIDLPTNAIIVGDLFLDPQRLALPIACVTSSIYVGSALGTIAEPLAQSLGWRGAVACFGLLTSAAVLNASILVSNYRSASGGGVAPTPRSSLSEAHSAHQRPHRQQRRRQQQHHHQHQQEVVVASPGDQGPPRHHHQQKQEKHLGYDSINEPLPAAEPLRSGGRGRGDCLGGENAGGSEERIQITRGLRVTTTTPMSPRRSDGPTTSTIHVICSSPRLLLLYLGSGVRYMAGLSMLGWNPVFFEIAFPGERRMMIYAVNATISVAVCGTVSQLLGAKCFEHTVAVTSSARVFGDESEC